MLCLKARVYWLLIMKASHPISGKTVYFVDKCLPFGHSISCALFQRFSDALAHVTRHLITMKLHINQPPLTNYLDDFLFAAIKQILCNATLGIFVQFFAEINVPIALEKTEWVTVMIVFLGILLDGQKQILAIPTEKKERALQAIESLLNKCKAAVKELQSLAGFLNFLNQAIVPGRAFTRRMYAKFSGLFAVDSRDNGVTAKRVTLKQHHHIRLDSEFKGDCMVWKEFLGSSTAAVY